MFTVCKFDLPCIFHINYKTFAYCYVVLSQWYTASAINERWGYIPYLEIFDNSMQAS